jgi:hypothetical protein
MAGKWWRILANEAPNRILKGYRPEASVIEMVDNALMAAGLKEAAGRQVRRGALAAANYAGTAALRYFWPAIPDEVARKIWLKRIGRVGAAWAALDVTTRLAGPGGMLYDDYGRFNIAGVPFI